MESPAPASRYIPQNSKKRVFMAESSSSGYTEVEVLELSPAIDRVSKPKQKEVYQEIIDVDMDGEGDEVMMTDPEVDPSAKGKEVLSNSSGGLNNDESGSDTLTSKYGAASHDSTNVDDLSSNQFYGEDGWIDTYYDDILYEVEEDYSTLESHFDHMDIPTGVEVSFPWLTNSPKNDTMVPSSSTSTHQITKPESDNINPSTGSNSSDPSWDNQATDVEMDPVNQLYLSSLWSKTGSWKKSATSTITANTSSQSSQSPSFHQTGKEPFHYSGKTKQKPWASHAFNSSHYTKLSSSPYYHPSAVNGGGSFPTPYMPPKGLGLGSHMPVWQDLHMNAFEPALSASGLMNGKDPFSNLEQDFDHVNPTSPIEISLRTKVDTAKAEQRNLVEVLHNFENFKKFNTVEDYSDHHYSKNGSSAKQPPKNWAKRIQEEWKILEKNLPDEVFVRVYESRMDLLRAVIIGAEGTPYHDGLFFFDVFFPSTYPNVPPHVHYHSRGLRINPNLYGCGKVCLSLLNTWSGSQKEKWIPGVSTMLQVLVSIQGLILNTKPYFNEPGYADMGGTAMGEMRSSEYNEKTFIYNLQTMVYNMRRPPKHFEDFAIGYFCKHGRGIIMSCKAYLNGAQVGCLVKGGVQDVDKEGNSCSQEFKSSLGVFMTTLINQFLQIGAKDCDEFLYLTRSDQAAPPVVHVHDYFDKSILTDFSKGR